MPYQSRASAILSDWREVERDLLTVEPGTPEASRLRAEADGLREEYQRLVEDALRNDHPALPPFPGAFEAEAN
jgi:hypothetical protein